MVLILVSICIYLTVAKNMKKKPTILLNKTRRMEYKLSTFVLVLSIMLFNGSAPLMASNLINGDASSGTISDATQPHDSFNAASFEQGSHGTTSSNQQPTLIGRVGEVMCVLGGIAFVGGVVFGGYKQYARNLDPQAEMEENQAKRWGTPPVSESSDEELGSSIKKVPSAGMALEPNDQQKMLDGITPLLSDKVRSFVTTDKLFPEEKLNLAIYFFYHEDDCPNQKYEDLKHSQIEDLLSSAADFRNTKFKNNVDLGLCIAEEQALSEMKKDFLPLGKNEGVISPEGSMSSTDSAFVKDREAEGKKMRLYMGFINKNIFQNKELTKN